MLNVELEVGSRTSRQVPCRCRPGQCSDPPTVRRIERRHPHRLDAKENNVIGVAVVSPSEEQCSEHHVAVHV